jgi:hypothetical protein
VVWNRRSSRWYGTRRTLGGMEQEVLWAVWNKASSRWCGTRGALGKVKQGKLCRGGVEQEGL